MTLINLVKARSRQKDAAVIRSDPVQAQHADRVTAQDLVLLLVRQPLQVVLGESSAATMWPLRCPAQHQRGGAQ
jgi:hypothetical protein